MADLAELEEKIGYKFGKREYLRRAMTHSSY
ncbi:MAG TPA: ribonuclease III, partial [Ruminococcaceae bacterium]|nr:ribonuclease III [Oscillospiraceae bacterium]